MRTNMVRATLAIAAIVGLAAPAALASGLPKLPQSIGRVGHSQFEVKPVSIIVSGDGALYFAGRKTSHSRPAPLKWTSWTATGGHGSGFYWVNNCKPACADGTFHQYPVKLHVWRPKHVDGHFIFTRMTVTYTGTRPPHTSHKTEVLRAYGQRGIFTWT